IIWSDSRAVAIGNAAFAQLNPPAFLDAHLNSPGNFTASKLAWVKQNEPATYEQVHKFMLPGDYLSMCFTGEINSNISSISEGILWDFQKKGVSDTLLNHYGVSSELVPEILPVFGNYGSVKADVAEE